MIIYDFVRGYQPFYPPKFVPYWVKENLEEVFLPTSQAMRLGVVPRHVVIQAWTLDNWFSSDSLIKSLAKDFLNNLKEAQLQGFVEIGASSYSHVLLPLLSDELVEFSIRAGVESITEKLEQPPTWFWFPDGAVDRRVLEILHRLYPDLIAIVPDGCVGKTNYCGFDYVDYGREDSESILRGRVIVFSTLLKFLFLDSYLYDQRPGFLPRGTKFDLATKMAYDSKALGSVLKNVGGSKERFVLVREWENKTSRDGLEKTVSQSVFGKYPAMDISSFIKSDENLKFKLVAEDCWDEATVFKSSQIKPSSWEPFASKNNPYPLWLPGCRHSEFISESQPSRSRNKFGMTSEVSVNLDYLTAGQKAVIESWKSFIDICNSVLSENPKVEYLPLLISDIPWNILAPAEYKPDPMFVKRIIEEMFVKIASEVGDRDLAAGVEKLRLVVDKYVKESYEGGKWKVG